MSTERPIAGPASDLERVPNIGPIPEVGSALDPRGSGAEIGIWGKPDREIGPGNPTRSRDWEVVHSEMHTIGVRSEGEIEAVIDQEGGAMLQAELTHALRSRQYLSIRTAFSRSWTAVTPPASAASMVSNSPNGASCVPATR